MLTFPRLVETIYWKHPASVRAIDMSIAIHVTNNLESLQRYEISAAFLELLDAIVLDQHRVLWFGESPNGPKVGFDSFAAPSKKIIKY